MIESGVSKVSLYYFFKKFDNEEKDGVMNFIF